LLVSEEGRRWTKALLLCAVVAFVVGSLCAGFPIGIAMQDLTKIGDPGLPQMSSAVVGFLMARWVALRYQVPETWGGRTVLAVATTVAGMSTAALVSHERLEMYEMLSHLSGTWRWQDTPGEIILRSFGLLDCDWRALRCLFSGAAVLGSAFFTATDNRF